MVTLCKVVENLNTIEDIRNFEDEGIRDIYIKEDNVQIHNQIDELIIVDLENAMRIGKFCKLYTFYTKNEVENWLDYFEHQLISEIIKNCRSGKYEDDAALKKASIIYSETVKPSEEVFCPFKKTERQNLYLPDITNTMLAKAILAGQIEKITSKGKKLNLLEFACDCYNDKYGFWCYIKQDKQLRVGWYDMRTCDVFLR